MKAARGSGRGSRGPGSWQSPAKCLSPAEGSAPGLPSPGAQTLEASHHPPSPPGVCLQVEVKGQEVQDLQQQRDEYLNHLQQYVAAYQQHVAAYQQLASEKEALHKQVLLQTQLLDRLQHEEVQGKVAMEVARQELQETQVRASERWAPEREGLRPVSLLTPFPGPLGAPGSCQPAEPAASGPADAHGCAWGRSVGRPGGRTLARGAGGRLAAWH